ncbi:MAG: hypothetical protein M3Q10_13325 [Chloroflexota bacterium]|nr:hypothetical protein [Chloroflexota bacterium]
MAEPTASRPSRRDAIREDRLEILRLLEAGTVTADEAATLLDALDRSSPTPEAPRPTPPSASGGGVVRICITESGSDHVTTNLAFPLALIDSGLKIAGQFVPEYLPKAEAIRDSVKTGFRGALVDVDDGDQRVEIVVE